jgi:hypothetical protein
MGVGYLFQVFLVKASAEDNLLYPFRREECQAMIVGVHQEAGPSLFCHSGHVPIDERMLGLTG